MKKLTILFLMATLVFTLPACAGVAVDALDTEPTAQPDTRTEDPSSTNVSPQQDPLVTVTPISADYDPDDLNTTVDNDDLSYINLEDDTITFQGNGATVGGNIVTITSAGVYSINGSLNDGQIVVDTQDTETVVLVLNGATITSTTSAPLYVRNAEKTIITLAEGSENYITDGTSYVFEDAEADEPNAAIFSKDDLTINGSGSLTVNANYNNGIVSKDDLKIIGGSIKVNAVNDGIKGRDSIAVKDGTIIVNASGDGMQSNNDEDSEKGFVVIEGGTLNITATLDGIQAETDLLVSGGDITITSGGGSAESSNVANWGGRGMGGNPNKTDESAKGLKAGVDITITNGVVQINSLDDAIHSDNNITINGGDLFLASSDDGLHADSTLTVNGGTLAITHSYEGLESATITINGGNIHIVASDDGINAVSDDSTAAGGGMMPGPRNFEAANNYLYINGGYLAIDAMGDGLDVNGTIDMTGGLVIVNGPTNNGNGPLDYLGAFNITGGFLVAVGSAGMAQAPSMSSTQYSMMYIFDSPQAAGTMVHIEAEDGEEILTFVPTKEYQSVVVSSPELKNGLTYYVYTGGSSSGTTSDGLYSGGTYTAGTQVTSFTVSSVVTVAGAYGGGFPGSNMPGPGGRRRP